MPFGDKAASGGYACMTRSVGARLKIQIYAKLRNSWNDKEMLVVPTNSIK